MVCLAVLPLGSTMCADPRTSSSASRRSSLLVPHLWSNNSSSGNNNKNNTESSRSDALSTSKDGRDPSSVVPQPSPPRSEPQVKLQVLDKQRYLRKQRTRLILRKQTSTTSGCDWVVRDRDGKMWFESDGDISGVLSSEKVVFDHLCRPMFILKSTVAEADGAQLWYVHHPRKNSNGSHVVEIRADRYSTPTINLTATVLDRCSGKYVTLAIVGTFDDLNTSVIFVEDAMESNWVPIGKLRRSLEKQDVTIDVNERIDLALMTALGMCYEEVSNRRFGRYTDH